MKYSKEQLVKLSEYLGQLADEIPRGLFELKWAAELAALDLAMLSKTGKQPKDSLLKFVEKIPVVEDFKDYKLTEWMIDSKEYENYLT